MVGKSIPQGSYNWSVEEGNCVSSPKRAMRGLELEWAGAFSFMILLRVLSKLEVLLMGERRPPVCACSS